MAGIETFVFGNNGIRVQTVRCTLESIVGGTPALCQKVCAHYGRRRTEWELTGGSRTRRAVPTCSPDSGPPFLADHATVSGSCHGMPVGAHPWTSTRLAVSIT
jgi:hypothetical protein